MRVDNMKRSLIRKIPGFRSGKKWKMILASIGYFFIFMIILSYLAYLSEDSDNSQTSSKKEQSLITKSPYEMLPTRNDLSTEWQFGGDGVNETINATGFDSGALMTVRKTSDITPTQVTVHIYKFNSIDNANDYYQTSVNDEKQTGGYKEVSTYRVNADCYAGKQESFSGEIAFIYCIKKNVVFYLRAIILYTSGASDDMTVVAKTIPPKIS